MTTPNNQSPFSFNARAEIVNRTHRIVREQALAMREQKQRGRSLLAPLAICSVLLMILCYSIWNVVDSFELNDVPDVSGQMMVVMLLAMPVLAVVLGAVWYSRNINRANGEV
jgi:hypothetical protein